MSLLNMQGTTLSDIAEAIRSKLDDSSTYLPGEMAEKIGLIRRYSIKAGKIQIPSSTGTDEYKGETTLLVPATGKIINIEGLDVPEVSGNVCHATWSAGPINDSPIPFGAYDRYNQSADSDGNPTIVHTQSGISVTKNDDGSLFSTANSARVFAAGVTYTWSCLDWDDETVVAVYDVSGSSEDDKVQLAILHKDGDAGYTAYLGGSGATLDYTKEGIKPWADYIDSITAIYIDKGITSLGEYLFAEHTAVEHLQFADSSAIEHLGDRCFWRCTFGGEFSFPGLKDDCMKRAFGACMNLRGVTLSETVKEINPSAFIYCLNLRRVSGLENVEHVNECAFMYTPKLESVDLDPAVCTSIDQIAFNISPAMSKIDVDEWSGTTFGENACASVDWTEEQLAEIRSVPLPNVMLWDKTVLGDTPDDKDKYDENAGEEFLYCTYNSSNGTIEKYLNLGCESCSLCTVWNILKETKYTNLGEWWVNEVYNVYKAKHDGALIGETDVNYIFETVLDTVGFQRKTSYPIYATADGFNVPAVKQAIATELSNGIPLILLIWHSSTYTGHAVAVIGADATTDKLIIADNIHTPIDRGCIYKVALEDIIGIGEYGQVNAYVPIV